jgi:hypothetical protein
VFEISSNQWNKARAYAKRLGLNGGIEAGNVGSFFFNGQHNAVDDVGASRSSSMHSPQSPALISCIRNFKGISRLYLAHRCNSYSNK